MYQHSMLHVAIERATAEDTNFQLFRCCHREDYYYHGNKIIDALKL